MFSIHAMETLTNMTHGDITADEFRVDLCSLQVVRRVSPLTIKKTVLSQGNCAMLQLSF